MLMPMSVVNLYSAISCSVSIALISIEDQHKSSKYILNVCFWAEIYKVWKCIFMVRLYSWAGNALKFKISVEFSLLTLAMHQSASGSTNVVVVSAASGRRNVNG